MLRIQKSAGRMSRAVIAVLLLLPACSSRPPEHDGHLLHVKIKDFTVQPARLSVEDGLVTLSVWNEGPSTHEFVVVPSDRSADELPIAVDGISVDEDAVVPVDELAEIEAKERGILSLSLSPGHYVLFCNLEGHYLAGMHASLEVIAA
jgi:uncharacterized cupredoxin-like copper-binding protein